MNFLVYYTSGIFLGPSKGLSEVHRVKEFVSTCEVSPHFCKKTLGSLDNKNKDVTIKEVLRTILVFERRTL